MNTLHSLATSFALTVSLWAFGCAAEDDPESSGASGTGGTSGGEDTEADPSGDPSGAPGQCSDTSENDYVYDPPGECFNNPGCASCTCIVFQDNPPTDESMCGEAPDGQMRITGTLFEFPGQTPIPNQSLRIVGAFDIGTLGPVNAPSLIELTSDADGRLDTRIDKPEDGIGIVAIVQAPGYRDTATGVAKPEGEGLYESANAIHDLFVVPESTLTAYSDALASDAALEPYLPLGDQGGVVGIARNRYTGEPMAGVQIVSLNSTSFAEVRYLNEDGTFGTSATSATGVYALLNPGLAEEFEAQLDGAVVSTRPNKAGSGPPGIFTMNLTIDTDPGANPFE